MLKNLHPGDQILRRELHERYGGRQQGGIGPSRKAPVILFFTDPAAGHRHGYYDGWDDDGLFNGSVALAVRRSGRRDSQHENLPLIAPVDPSPLHLRRLPLPA